MISEKNHILAPRANQLILLTTFLIIVLIVNMKENKNFQNSAKINDVPVLLQSPKPPCTLLVLLRNNNFHVVLFLHHPLVLHLIC